MGPELLAGAEVFGSLIGAASSIGSLLFSPDEPDIPEVEETKLKTPAKDTAKKSRQLASVRKKTVLTDPLGAAGDVSENVALPTFLGE